jgi:hypothetical protein
MRPYFVYQENALVLDDSFRNYPGWHFQQTIMNNGGYWLIDHLKVLQFLNEAKYAIKGRFTRTNQNMLAGELRHDDHKPELARNEAGLDTMVYLEPIDQFWREAWRVMRNEIRQRGADFLVVTLTNGDQVDPDPMRRAAQAKTLGVSDLLYPERRVAALGKREGISVLNLAKPFADYAEKHNMFMHGFKNGVGHWNSEGHHLAGQLIAETICLSFIGLSPSQVDIQ